MSSCAPTCPGRQVSYKTQNFLDKNRDFVVAEHQALMQASSETFTHLLFPSDPDAVRAAALLSQCSSRAGSGANHLPRACCARKSRTVSDLPGCAFELAHPCVCLTQFPRHTALHFASLLPIAAESRAEDPGAQAAKPGGKNIGQGYKFASVASRFKRQLAELMDALHTMEPHYIRCIKPNSFNRCAGSVCVCSGQGVTSGGEPCPSP